jgi:hypothetical protein
MPLHLTKVAFGASGVEHLAERLLVRAETGPVFLTTRYMPKRREEIAGQGSLFWIIKHTLVARSPILSFGEAEGGRKRAHQGWRYLEDPDAPLDLGDDFASGDALPAALIGKLAALGLV